MDNSKITDIIFAVLADNHELRLPEFLIIRDLVVIGFTFADLENTLGAIDGDFKIFEFFGINSLKFHVQLVGSSAVGKGLKSAALEINRDLELAWGKLTHADGVQITVVHELVQTWVLGKRKTSGQGLDLVSCGIKLGGVGLDLVLERVVTDARASIDDLLDENSDLFGVFRQAENEVAGDGSSLVGGQVHLVELGNLVQVGQLTEGAKEVIGGNGGLALEEGEPEDLGVLGAEELAHLSSQVVVHDVLEVNFVEIVGPWVQHGEALVLYALSAVLLDVFLEELEVGLVSVDGVTQVILVDGFLLVADEGADGLDARARLQVLRLDDKVEEASDLVVVAGTNLAQYANEDLLEALKVPVLVNARVDDA